MASLTLFKVTFSPNKVQQLVEHTENFYDVFYGLKNKRFSCPVFIPVGKIIYQIGLVHLRKR
jgi:hypothetical protein